MIKTFFLNSGTTLALILNKSLSYLAANRLKI